MPPKDPKEGDIWINKTGYTVQTVNPGEAAIWTGKCWRPTTTWVGGNPKTDDFGQPIKDIFYDAKITGYGLRAPWAIMSPASWAINGNRQLGPGLGQKYKRFGDRFVKVEG